MANAARVHAIESGKDLRPRTLIAFGGAAPLHAARVAEKLGMQPRAHPRQCGRRLGGRSAARACRIRDRARPAHPPLQTSIAAAANRLLAEMRAEAEAIVRRGAPDAELIEHRSALMRYRGQGHEIAVALPVRDFTAADRTTIRESVRGGLSRLYSRAIPGVEIEILSWVVSAERAGRGPPRRASEETSREAKAAVAAADCSTRTAGKFREVPVYWRADLAPGARIRGPAVIGEDETSTVIRARFDARIDRFGYIELTRREA